MPRQRGRAAAASSDSDDSSIGSDAGGGAVKNAHDLSSSGKVRLGSAKKARRRGACSAVLGRFRIGNFSASTGHRLSFQAVHGENLLH